MNLILRPIVEGDLKTFFEHQRDPVATAMISYLPRDPDDEAAFMNHWKMILERTDVLNRAIEVDGVLVGNIVSYPMQGQIEVGYFIDRAYWGKGIATEALKQLLQIQTIRPLYAHVLSTNIGSLRALEKNGFKVMGSVENETVLQLL